MWRKDAVGTAMERGTAIDLIHVSTLKKKYLLMRQLLQTS